MCGKFRTLQSRNAAEPAIVNKSPLLPIFLIVLVDILGLTIILPLLPFYAEKLGASATVVGLLISSYAACQLIAGPILGRISDRVGRRPVLIVSQVGTLIGFLILAAANVLWLVFLSRIIDGLTAGNLSLAQAYIADVTAPKNRAKSFGVIGIAFGIGFLIGPAVSGFLSQYGYHYPILAAAALSATSILCTFFLLPAVAPAPLGQVNADEPPPPAGARLGVLDWNGYVEYFRRPELKNLLWQFFLFAFCFATFVSGFALFAQRRFTIDGQPWGPKQIGYVFAYVGFLGIILQGGLIGRMVKWFGEPRLVWSGFLAAAVGFAGLGFAYNLPALLIVSAVASYGTGVLRPAITSLITQQAGRREQGVVLGLTQSLTSVSQIIAPVIAGMLIDRGLLAAWALVAAGTAGIGFLVSKFAGRQNTPTPAGSP
ncbi:MAG: MFS transporter [Acidobacteriota bacterium]|nr:MFS transporter [Acidobacteriota bacterium]